MKFNHSDLHFSHDNSQPISMSVETLLAEYADGRRHFDNVDLREANLNRAKLPMISLEESILQKAKLSGANLAGATLNHADFSFATLTTANFIAADLVRAKLIGANLAGAVMSGANLSGASFRKADLTDCIFAGANLSGVDFSGAVLSNANFGGATLKGANLSEVDLTEVDLTDLDLTESILPEGLAGERWGSQNRDLSINFDQVVPGWGSAGEALPEWPLAQNEIAPSKMIAAETGRYLVDQNQEGDLDGEDQPTEYLEDRSPFDPYIASDEPTNEGYVVSAGTSEEYVTEEYEAYVAEEYTEEYAPEQYAPEEYISEPYVAEQYASEEYVTEQYVTEQYVTGEHAEQYVTGAYSTEAYTEKYATEEYLEGYATGEFMAPEEYVTGADLGTDELVEEETYAVVPLSSLEAEELAALDAAEEQWSGSAVAFDDEDDLYLHALDALDAIAMEDNGTFENADSPQPPTTDGEDIPTASSLVDSMNPFVLGDGDNAVVAQEFAHPSDHLDHPFVLGFPPINAPEESTIARAEGVTAAVSDLTEPVDFTATDPDLVEPVDFTATDPDLPEPLDLVISEAAPHDSLESVHSTLPEPTGLVVLAEEEPGDPEEKTQFIRPENKAEDLGDEDLGGEDLGDESVASRKDRSAFPAPLPLNPPTPTQSSESSTHPGGKAHPSLNSPSLNSRVVHSIQAVLGRRVQYSLQRKLLDIYHGKCAITGCNIQPLLETVFITSHDRDKADHPSQCLVLRADLKTLYDLKLLAIHPQNLTVLLSPQLMASDYGYLQNQRITIPEQKIYHPSPESLDQHLQDCTWYNKGYQDRPQPSASALSDLPHKPAQRWLNLPSLVTFGVGILVGAGLMWPLRSALMGQPSGLEAESSPTQLRPQSENRINIQAGNLRYNQQGILIDQKSYITLEQAQQLGLLNGEVPENYQQPFQGKTYVSLSYLATLGIPTTWDAESRTATLDCCQSQALETISLAINNRNWPEAGIIVDDRAYVPQSKLADLNLDLDALNPAHSINYQNDTYVRANDLKDLAATVQWDAETRVLRISN